MRTFLLSAVSLLTILSIACGSDSTNPTAPGMASPVLRTVSISPTGVGLEKVTEFTFSADTDAAAPESTFHWQFGDGSSTTGGATVTHVYAGPGAFTVQLTVRNASGQATASSTVRVMSLVGTWMTTITGHTGYPSQRPVPITSVELRLDQSPPGSDPTVLAGIWRDDAGCRAGTGYPSSIFGSARHPRTVSIGVDGLFCNDGDLYLNGTADDDMRVITGTCSLGGPDCQFAMVRQ